MKTAKVVLHKRGWRGEATCFEVNPPWPDNEDDDVYPFIIVSHADTCDHGHETFIFPSTKKGEAINFGELPGSERGRLSPQELLGKLGYIVIEKES